MRVTQRTSYYLSKSGRFGNYYSKQNVSPYFSVWKFVTKYFHGESIRKVPGEPVCVFHNVTGPDDPCIPKRIRAKIQTWEEWYYEH